MPVTEDIDKQIKEFNLQGTFYVNLLSLNIPPVSYEYFEPYVRVTFPGGDQCKSRDLESNIAVKIDQIIANKVFMKTKVSLPI